MIRSWLRRGEAHDDMPEQSDDAAMQHWLGTMPDPQVPPDLADRIIQDVPRLAQMPVPVALGTPPAGRPVAQVLLLRSAMWQRAAAPVRRKAGHAERLARVGQFAALAAAVAVVVVQPQVRHDPHESAKPDRAPRSEAHAPLTAPSSVAAIAQVSFRKRARPLPHGVQAPAVDDPAQPDPAVDMAAVTHAPPPLPPPTMAVAGPLVGPTDTSTGLPAQLGGHGVMGPVLPQGYGYAATGGSPGGEFGVAPAGPGPAGPGGNQH